MSVVREESFVRLRGKGAALCWKWGGPVYKTHKVTFAISCHVHAGWWSLPTLKYRTFIVNFTLTYLLLTRAQGLWLTLYSSRAAALRFSWNLIVFSVVSRSAMDRSVGIATRYELDCPGIESRWGARFSAPVQTGPGSHPASYTVGTGSFPGVKRPGRGVTTHPHLAPRLRKDYSYTSTPNLGVRGLF
jgi:hypothetical protein